MMRIVTKPLHLWIVLAAGLWPVLGCSSSERAEPEPDHQTQQSEDAEAASEAVAEMLSAAQSGDWQTYVEHFYGEQHKFAAPEERDQLIERFRDQWGEQVLPVLEDAVEITPRIVEDRALFERDGELIFILYRADDGQWTFHI